MIVSKKKHLEKVAKLENTITNLREQNESQQKAHRKQLDEQLAELRKFFKRASEWIRVRGHENFGPNGERLHTYTVQTEFTAEFLHYGMGGSHKMARLITKELAEQGYLALVALCHLDQPPKLYGKPPPWPRDEELGI